MEMHKKVWVVTRDEHRHGPYTLTQLEQLAVAGALGSDDMLWKPDLKAPFPIKESWHYTEVRLRTVEHPAALPAPAQIAAELPVKPPGSLNKRVILRVLMMVPTVLLALWAWKAWEVPSEVAHWPTTTGVVIAGDTQYLHKAGRYAVWHYRYQVGGETYTAQSDGEPFAYPVEYFKKAGEAERSLGLRPNGSTVTVYYDPANPQRSTLDRPRQEIPLTPLFLMLMCLLVFAVDSP